MSVLPVSLTILLAGCTGDLPESTHDGGSAGDPSQDGDDDDSGDEAGDEDDDGSGGSEEDCTPAANEGCYDGDVYSYDSCGEREGRVESCGSDEECVEDDGRASCESTCEENAETRCYGGDVYNYDSCGDRGDLEESCGSNEECVDHGSYASCEESCTSKAATACYDGDVYYADSCGNVESRKESCELGCIESGSSADCLDFDLECEEIDHGCVADSVDMDIECTFDNRTAFPLTLDSVKLAVDGSDSSALDEWDDDTWSSGATVAAGASYVLDDEFNADFDYVPSDNIVHLEADLTFEFSGASVTITDWEGPYVVLLDSWMDACED